MRVYYAAAQLVLPLWLWLPMLIPISQINFGPVHFVEMQKPSKDMQTFTEHHNSLLTQCDSRMHLALRVTCIQFAHEYRFCRSTYPTSPGRQYATLILRSTDMVVCETAQVLALLRDYDPTLLDAPIQVKWWTAWIPELPPLWIMSGMPSIECGRCRCFYGTTPFHYSRSILQAARVIREAHGSPKCLRLKCAHFYCLKCQNREVQHFWGSSA